MNPIGGYFELELQNESLFHDNLIAVNSGRNALELILRKFKYTKIFIPLYSCKALLQPINKLNIDFEFYSINDQFEPIFDYKLIKPSEAILYINYFGIKDDFISGIVKKVANLIIDNSQSFFSIPIKDVPTFYSPRKFFGIPDGGFASFQDAHLDNLDQDKSLKRMSHLLNRLEGNIAEGYIDFKLNEELFEQLPLMSMSEISKRILKSINYHRVKESRIKNYKFFHDQLEQINPYRIEFNFSQPPMHYLYKTENEMLYKKLLNKNVFIPRYWPGIDQRIGLNTFEIGLIENTLFLPIDHRYSIEHMQIISEIIKES